eukprot:maker-scaffold_56-snap-gene-1.80-mRNA-1 protein AED:0.00 eAED:0.00 QI:242/1/1/1/1/1/2/227/255
MNSTPGTQSSYKFNEQNMEIYQSDGNFSDDTFSTKMMYYSAPRHYLNAQALKDSNLTDEEIKEASIAMYRNTPQFKQHREQLLIRDRALEARGEKIEISTKPQEIYDQEQEKKLKSKRRAAFLRGLKIFVVFLLGMSILIGVLILIFSSDNEDGDEVEGNEPPLDGGVDSAFAVICKNTSGLVEPSGFCSSVNTFVRCLNGEIVLDENDKIEQVCTDRVQRSAGCFCGINILVEDSFPCNLDTDGGGQNCNPLFS